MPLERYPGKSILREDPVEDIADNSCEVIKPPSKRRRIFLRTMGQQLRDVGLTGDSEDASHIQFPNNRSKRDRPHNRPVPIQTPESDAVPGEDDQLPARATTSASKDLWHPGEVTVMPATDDNDSFTFEDLLGWTQSYFDNWHPAYPFLYAPSILEHFEFIVHHGVTDAATSPTYQLTILRALISISLADRRQTGVVMRPVPARLVFTSFNNATQSIDRALIDEGSILSLQAVVSVQLFLVSMLRYNAASRLDGLVVRIAFHLGLHRCPMQFTTLPDKEAELRQRLFWSIYCIDRYICIRLGVPLAIRDRDIDVCFPSLERHRGRANEQSNSVGQLDLLEFLARHAEIRGSITELRDRFVSDKQTETDDAVVIDARLAKWWNGVDEYLESNNSEALPISRDHQVTLVVLRYESIIALNKHTLATSKKSSAYDVALQNCIGASRSTINTLYKALETRMNVEHSGAQEVENSGLLWPSFTWAVWMSTFIMIYAANEDQVPQYVAIRLADRALEVLKHLTLRGSMWPNACAVAIRKLCAQLIDRRKRSKHTHFHESQVPRDVQTESVPGKPSRSIPLQSNNDTELGAAPNASMRLQHPQSLGPQAPSLRGSHRMLHSRHDDGNTRDALNTPDSLVPSFTYDLNSNNFFVMPHSSIGLQNWMFSELVPNAGDVEGNEYAHILEAQLGPELSIPNGADGGLFYRLNAQFSGD